MSRPYTWQEEGFFEPARILYVLHSTNPVVRHHRPARRPHLGRAPWPRSKSTRPPSNGFCYRAKHLLEEKGIDYDDRRHDGRGEAPGDASARCPRSSSTEPPSAAATNSMPWTAKAVSMPSSAPTAGPREDDMSDSFKVACVQTNSGREFAANIETVGGLVRAAAAAGAEFVLLPETVSLMEPRRRLLNEKVRAEEDDPMLAACRDLARQAGIWMLAGSMVVRVSADKVANRSFLLGPDGSIAARYDKIHMVRRRARQWRVLPGIGGLRARRRGRGRRSAVGAPRHDRLLRPALPLPLPHPGPCGRRLPDRAVGLHPHHGPRPLARPAQGPGHRDGVLRLRAGAMRRACGRAPDLWPFADHRPWGEVLADGGEEVGFVVADIDPAAVAVARRRKVPSLTHDRQVAPPAEDTAASPTIAAAS